MAIFEQDKVLYEEASNGDKTIIMPVTRANNVEGLGRSANTKFVAGEVVYVDNNKKIALKCIAGGTTGTGELDVSSRAVGETVEDGTVAWKVISRDIAEEMLKNSAKGINISKLSLAGNRTIADLRTAIEGWLNSNNFSTGVVAFGSDGSFVDAWNNEDLTHSLPDASWWYVHILGGYYDANYTQLLITSYINKEIYIVHKADNVWGKIHKLATNGALSMPSDSGVAIQIAGDGQLNYTAPADGWITVAGSPKATPSRILLITNTGMRSAENNSTSSFSSAASLPLAKGDVVDIYCNNITSQSAYFFYAQSEV